MSAEARQPLAEAVERFMSAYRERYRNATGQIRSNAPMRDEVRDLNSALISSIQGVAEASQPLAGDIAWLERKKEVSHCGEGTLERVQREAHNARIDRLLSSIQGVTLPCPGCGSITCTDRHCMANGPQTAEPGALRREVVAQVRHAMSDATVFITSRQAHGIPLDTEEIAGDLDTSAAEYADAILNLTAQADAASEYVEFYERHHGDFDAAGNYIPHSQMDGDLRNAEARAEALAAEVERLKGAAPEAKKHADELDRWALYADVRRLNTVMTDAAAFLRRLLTDAQPSRAEGEP